MKLHTVKSRLQVLGAQPRGTSGWAETRQGTSTERGYGAAWRKLREKIMKRDSYLCQECKRLKRVTAAYAVDHILCKAEWMLVNGSLDGVDNEANVEGICKPCHAVKTREESKRSYQRGMSSPVLGPVRTR